MTMPRPDIAFVRLTESGAAGGTDVDLPAVLLVFRVEVVAVAVPVQAQREACC